MWSHAAGLVFLVGLLAGWVAVQRAWRNAFPVAADEPDALALRGGCAGPDCSNDCRRRPPAAEATEEENP